MVRGVAVVAAGAGVHRGNEHKRGRVLHRVFCTADGDDTVLQRLAQHLEDGTRQLWHFVEEEYAVVGQRYFARLRIVAAADECHLRYRVVGCSEGPLVDEAGVA